MAWQANVPGICDRCGQRYLLKDLKMLMVLDRPQNLLVCDDCWEPSHPQLDTRHVRTDDKQSVSNPRSDQAELADSRKLSGWNPVGGEATGYMEFQSGRVTVTTT